jgi:hypothetical protein
MKANIPGAKSLAAELNSAYAPSFLERSKAAELGDARLQTRGWVGFPWPTRLWLRRSPVWVASTNVPKWWPSPKFGNAWHRAA